ncbi:MAG: DUF444 family protein [Gemmatimonadetes bacterium]|nr:DUF444 family protein [Gemmatimonadota bacterium]
MLRIDRDHSRFKKIVRGAIKENLREYIKNGEMIGRQGGRYVSIPVPSIELPHFKFGQPGSGGVGQGDGEEGEGVQAEAGDQPGQHILEVDVPLDDLAAILGEELGLPNIEPRGKMQIEDEHDRYSSIRRTGPESLRHFKRTYTAALKRQIAAGTYNRKNPVIIPIREDQRYRSWKTVEQPESSAVIIYMMDVSGSMGDEQKEMVRLESFWIDTWLRTQYKNLETRFIVHDAVAHLVDRETFFHTRESGGTKISCAYELCWQLIERDFAPDEWNIYPFHFSDGDNWGGGDTDVAVGLMKDRLLPVSNQFSYGQVKSLYGTGQFIKDLREKLPNQESLVLSEINSKDDIYGSIREFLGGGR